MSNPSINRWGLSVFWHHLWYSDLNYASYLQQDKIILFLIETYLRYGSNLTTQLFWTSFWRKKSWYHYRVPPTRYYRWAQIKHPFFQTISIYRFRATSEEIYSSRTVLLRFNSWLLLNFYWFRPQKPQVYKAKILRSNFVQPSISPVLGSLTQLVKLRSSILQTCLNRVVTSVRYQF